MIMQRYRDKPRIIWADKFLNLVYDNTIMSGQKWIIPDTWYFHTQTVYISYVYNNQVRIILLYDQP